MFDSREEQYLQRENIGISILSPFPTKSPFPVHFHTHTCMHPCTRTHARMYLLGYSETRQLHSHVLKCLYLVNKRHFYYHYISPLSRVSVVE